MSATSLLTELEERAHPIILTKRQQINIYIVYFSVFLDNMGVSVVQPILPYYAAAFDANSLQLGMLYSSYSLMATFATIFMAKMSDHFGRRPMICFSLFGTMTGFLLTGLAWNYESLLAFRFYTGAFGGSFSVAQAYMTDVCPPDVLEKYLAGVGGTMAFAFIVGPLLGGALSQFSLSTPFYASAVFGAIGFIVSLIWLQESYFPIVIKTRDTAIKRLKDIKQKQDHTEKSKDKYQRIATDDENEIENVAGTNITETKETDIEEQKQESELNKPKEEEKKKKKIPIQVWIMMISYFLSSVGWCTFSAMFAQYLIDTFGLNTGQVSLLTTIIGTIFVITNIVVFTALSKLMGLYWLAVCGLALFAISLGLAPISGGIWGMLIFMCFGVGFGFGVIMPCMSAMGADYADEENRGTVLGWITVGNQVAYIFGPLIMGAVYAVDPELIFYTGAAFAAGSFCVQSTLLIFWPDTRIPKKYKIPKVDMDEEIKKFTQHPEKWKWKPTEPTKSDFNKLGKHFGTLLIERGYDWKKFYPVFTQILDLAFPPIRTDTWDNYYEDNRFLRGKFEKIAWDFEQIKALGQVSMMGESQHVVAYK
eukprot:269439_1